MDIQSAKLTVREFYDALDDGGADGAGKVMARYCAPGLLWRGFHPFNEINGPERVASEFWIPLFRNFGALQRRIDIFFAGENRLDGKAGTWVCSMGHLVGLHDGPWLGIRPTRKLAFLPYAAFHLVRDGLVVETAMYFDIPHLMMQAGLAPFPAQAAAQIVQPGPRTCDGLHFDACPEAEAQRTIDVINAMISDLGQWDAGMPLERELERTWHDDMMWWGPAGIGSCYTIERYAKQHAAPFRAAFAERSRTRHVCRIAEGCYGGFFGWPNFTAVHTGGFMGMPATGKKGEFRVIDIYRRAGERLAENWVFIDLLHFWHGQGVDVLGRSTRIDAA